MAELHNIADYRKHRAEYVTCMACAADWIAVFPVGAVTVTCPECGDMAGELIHHHDPNWFRRYMAGPDTAKRRFVLLNAARMERQRT
jgi:predicted RNA-binding Zn-ribbon protein involved in translation (DUF1610 family)